VVTKTKPVDDMIGPTARYERYIAAKDRFFKPAIINFFSREFPQLFGPVTRENIANELIGIFEKMNPETERLKHGQIFWNALDKNTRADSPKRRYVPVVLTLTTSEEIEKIANGKSFVKVREDSVARVIKEAYQQGGILSMRDIALIFSISDTRASYIRKKYEQEHKIVLPHTGSLHDMGSCITHKVQIVYKVIVEKKDPTQAAYETNHTQQAVDRYLNDFHRVNTLYINNQDIDFIHTVTNIAKHVVKQYIEIIEKYVQKHEK